MGRREEGTFDVSVILLGVTRGRFATLGMDRTVKRGYGGKSVLGTEGKNGSGGQRKICGSRRVRDSVPSPPDTTLTVPLTVPDSPLGESCARRKKGHKRSHHHGPELKSPPV